MGDASTMAAEVNETTKTRRRNSVDHTNGKGANVGIGGHLQMISDLDEHEDESEGRAVELLGLRDINDDLDDSAMPQ